MSHLDAVRSELRQLRERDETSGRRLAGLAVIAVLVVGVVAGLAELHLLPAFSADDFQSFLFCAG